MKTKVLVSTDDHGYREAYVKAGKAVFNTQTRQFSEYAGDEYLETGEIVVDAMIVED